ncbi:MAG: sterol desaturase family protein [Gammaproteobacteria bacterium]|nr:sterol desaturase family protein [Gammaproteobacteria bacterium]MCP4927621.1 sterol desaturase family protein [Gammaproteobacteria bacterium]
MLLDIEILLRLSTFAGIFLLMALLEVFLPRRQLRFSRLLRWPNNLSVTLINTLLVRLFFPLAAVQFALQRESSTSGLLSFLKSDSLLSICIAIILLDLAIYTQHIIFHRIPVLWRIHRMHHTDNDLDVTTGTRFHPVEMLLSMLIKLMVITIIGAPATAVLLFELILSSAALFNHANFALPAFLDRIMRLLIVTPDMHRVHHSILTDEMNSNYGFNLSIWDRIFRTYKAEPVQGQMNMTLGLATTQTAAAQRINKMLMEPLK